MRTLAVALLTLGDPGRLTGGYLYHLRMAEIAPRHGARLDFVSLPDRPFPLPILHGRRALAAVARSGADALVLDSIAAAFLAPWLPARRTGAPVVAMLHQPPGGIDHGPLRAALQSALDRLAYRYARLLMAASDSLKVELVAGGVPAGRIRVVPPGRDVALAPPGPARDLQLGRRAAILSVGNWLARKGIYELLEAFARLPEDAATLHMVGDHQADRRYARRVRARLERADLAGRVVVHGPVSREAVAALYRDADIFALPSFKEPYGTVYGEAMAFGLPVVGWRAGNLPHLADDGREGLLVRPGDVAGLARAIARLARDEGLRREMGAAAARRAAARPTWEESAALFFAAIRDAVA
jgi:glycosyltransferase involved in cell wall biosynthesis